MSASRLVRRRAHLRIRQRARRGRLLIEALVAVLLAAAVVSALLGVANQALAMGDAALQFDLAARSAQQGAALALRAPCALTSRTEHVDLSRRHVSDRAVNLAAGDVRVQDSWRSTGLTRHDSLARRSHIRVRCE